jgi:erythromycin esterase-like protein
VTELVGWLRGWNASHAAAPVGFYGIDLYNVPESARRVVAYLESTDPPAAAVARNRYNCFGRLDVNDFPEYGRRVLAGERNSCAEPAAAEFLDLARRMAASGEAHRPGDEALVAAWQNARVVMNGEAYYRSANLPTVESWNLRDRHMADTIDVLAQHLESGAAPRTKVVVWAHSSHLGDARRTERSGVGELNVGQLLRQRHASDAVLVGFTTYDGTVRAARSWGGRSDIFSLKAARTDSFAGLFHEVRGPAFFLNLRDAPSVQQALAGRMLERFIGVVYSAGSERLSHYYHVDLAHQFDGIVHIDRSTALVLR